MEYTFVSSLLHVVCISMFLTLCSKSLQSTDLGIQKKTCVSVWLLVCSSDVGVLFHYAHNTPLKTDTRQKIRETEVVHMHTHVLTWRKHRGTLTLTDAHTDHTSSQYMLSLPLYQ